VDNEDPNYPKTAFNYVLSNPLKAGLVEHLDYWPYSNYLDFIGKRNGKLCMKDKAFDIFQSSVEDLLALNIGYGDIPDVEIS
jgi:putative transposase